MKILFLYREACAKNLSCRKLILSLLSDFPIKTRFARSLWLELAAPALTGFQHGRFDWLCQQRLVDFLEFERSPVVFQVGGDLTLLGYSIVQEAYTSYLQHTY